MRVLVVGASGILAPAAAALVARGDAVIGVARSADGMPPGVETVVADARTGPLPGGWDAAIVYEPAVSAAVLRAMAGRVVLVRTSAAADPANGPLRLAADTLLLGWRPDRSWHSPEQVSVAAVEVLDGGASRVLGAVRPWRDRP